MVKPVLFRAPTLLYANPESRIYIIADPQGKVRAYLAGHPIPFLGIPETVEPSSIKAAQILLQSASIISDRSSHLVVTHKLRGGLPPLEWKIDPIDWKKFLEDHPLISSLYEQFTVHAPTLGAALMLAVPTARRVGTLFRVAKFLKKPLGKIFVAGTAFVTAAAVRYFSKLSTNKKIAHLQKQVTDLDIEVKNEKTDIKQTYSRLELLLKGSLEDPADRRDALRELFTQIDELKARIKASPNPRDPDLEIEIAAFADFINLVAGAIPDKKISHQVRMVGQASLSFGKAFQVARQLGNFVTAGLSGISNPLGLALSGASCIYSLFSSWNDPEPIEGVREEIQNLANQMSELENHLHIRLDDLRELISDFRLESLIAFKDLKGNIQNLKIQSSRYYHEMNTKLDRIYNNLTRGFVAIATTELNHLIFHQRIRLQENSLTPKQRDKLLIKFAFWAVAQSKNPLFTGMININTRMPSQYLPQDIRDILYNHTECELIGYLANYIHNTTPLANPYIWSQAAEGYIQLLITTPSSGDSSNRLDTFLEIYRTGVELQHFISTLQKNKDLFDHLLQNYREIVIKLNTLEIHRLQNALVPESADAIALDAHLSLIQAFCRLAFHGSCQTDLVFSSLLFGQGFSAVRLMKSADIRDYIQKEGNRQLTVRVFMNVLLETTEYIQHIIHQKIQLAQDTHPMITSMCQRLWLFASEYFPQPLREPYPLESEPHFTDLTEIRVTSFCFAIYIQNPIVSQHFFNTNSVHERDRLQLTPLHHTCLKNQYDRSSGLVLSRRVDITARDNRNNTPMHCIKAGPDAQRFATLLVQNGASPFAVNQEGERPRFLPAESSLAFQLNETIQKVAYRSSSYPDKCWGSADAPLHILSDSITLASYNMVELNFVTQGLTTSPHANRLKNISSRKDLCIYYDPSGVTVHNFKTKNSSVYPVSHSFLRIGTLLTENFLIAYSGSSLIASYWTHIKSWRISDKSENMTPFPTICTGCFPLNNDRLFLQFHDLSSGVWDINTAQMVTKFPGTISTIKHHFFGFLNIHQTIITVSEGTTPADPLIIKLWNSNDGTCKKELTEHTEKICSLLVFDNIFVSIDHGGTTIVWDAAGVKIGQAKLPIFSSPTPSNPYPKFSPNRVRLLGEEALLFLDNAGNLCIWDLIKINGQPNLLYPSQSGRTFLAFDINHEYLTLISPPPLSSPSSPHQLEVFRFDHTLSYKFSGPDIIRP